jgi:hypothetical protein
MCRSGRATGSFGQRFDVGSVSDFEVRWMNGMTTHNGVSQSESTNVNSEKRS